MRSVLVTSAVFCALGASPALSQDTDDRKTEPARMTPVAERFDLADHASADRSRRIPTERAMLAAPVKPRGMIESGGAPSIEIETADGGPVFAAGAFGRNGKDVPGLAHVRIGWEF